MIRRVPIKVERTAIKLPQHMKGQVKLWEITESTREEDIYELTEHYNMLVRKVTNKTGYSCVSLTNYTEHKNWIHFESVYEICRMKGWDAKLYLEGQFERCKHWVKLKYPFPAQLYSKNALKDHIKYLGDIVQKYQKDVNASEKRKGSETTTLKTEILRGVVQSVETLADLLDRNRMDDRAQYKALSIFNHWEKLSPFYLWSVQWFHDVLKDMDNKRTETYEREFDRINSSPTMQKLIIEAVRTAETEFNLPANMKF